MYETYWKLNSKPFENTPDPRFMYYSKKHEEALMRLLYAIKEEKGAAMLTGEYGSGKTILSRIVIDELIRNQIYEAALITHPRLSATQFLMEIIYQLRDEHVKGTKQEVLHMLQDIIYKNYYDGKKTVIIIDESQIIKSRDTLEELRLLLNFQLNDRFLITLVLIGQPEFQQKVRSLPQLEQRLGIRYHMTALDEDDTTGYIKHRIEVAGGNPYLFSQEAINKVFEWSKGIPRKINNICDMCLLIGFGQELQGITEELVDKVVSDIKMGVLTNATNV